MRITRKYDIFYKMSKLTIKEIANAAGVSPTTVSFVLNNRKGVSESTRQKILEIIHTMKFTPNRNSRRLLFRKSFNICLAMNPESSPFVDLFYFDVTRGIVDASARYDYNLIISMLNYGKGIKGHVPGCVKNHDADGIIFLQDTPESILKEAQALGIPFVLVDAESRVALKYTSINLDSECSVRVAIEYLVNKGHRDIGFITSAYLPRYYKQTITGFSKAMTEYRLPVNNSWIFTEAEDEHSAYRGMEKILKNKSLPSAMVCAGDRYAIGAIRCVQDKGFQVPGDISFIGMDNILLASHITPPLTTISYNTFEMGETAFELLIKKIRGETVESMIFPSESIVERSSVREFKYGEYQENRAYLSADVY
jgi:DNA-binding LacI/PurR family transcriptional regulator